MNETLNIGGALLVKLFGRANEEGNRFRERAGNVREIGVRRAVIGSVFFMILGLVSAVGTALVYGLGGYYVIQGSFTIGTIVAFGSYLGQLYGTLARTWPPRRLTSPLRWSASSASSKCSICRMRSSRKKMPIELKDVNGDLLFENVKFNYDAG